MSIRSSRETSSTLTFHAILKRITMSYSSLENQNGQFMSQCLYTRGSFVDLCGAHNICSIVMCTSMFLVTKKRARVTVTI